MVKLQLCCLPNGESVAFVRKPGLLPWFMVIHQVDAFASRAFQGNPAGVCLLEKPVTDSWMQNVALEMNLSETAFLAREGAGFRLRWFTPKAEVRLCGHATLASAHVLWETGLLPNSEIARFQTLSGELTAQRTERGTITLNFPARPTLPIEPTPALLKSVGVPIIFCGRSEPNYIVELESPDQLRNLKPDLGLLMTLPTQGLIVTSRSDNPNFDFLSRYFAPSVGVPEDPVTGSAHCTLGPLWSARLGRKRVRGYQASARGGEVTVTDCGDRVELEGSAVTVMRVELLGSSLPI